MAAFDASTVVRRSAQQISCNLNEEIAILDLGKSVYFGLEGVGAHIWGALEEPRSVAELCASVVDHFDVTAEACRADVMTFLTSLEEAGLIEAVE
ncbi:MAG TPA: PqqD family protein [Reyranella sp.]|nr:PqqD family protein [Reyranella sp.]